VTDTSQTSVEAWKAAAEKAAVALEQVQRHLVDVQMGLIAEEIRAYQPQDGSKMTVDMRAAARLRARWTAGNGRLRVTVDSVLAADGRELAGWLPWGGAVQVGLIGELIGERLRVCAAHGMSLDGDMVLPRASAPPPARVDLTTPEGLMIDRLWAGVRRIEDENGGDWNGGDLVNLISGWLTEVGYEMKDPTLENADL